MKVSLIGPVYPYRGGISHFTTLLGEKLKQSGHKVQVISFKKQFPKWLYPGKSDKDLSPGRLKIDAQFVLSPLNPIDWRKTIKTIMAFEPDIVVFQWWVIFWSFAYAFLLSRLKRKNIKTKFVIHNVLPHESHFIDRYLVRLALGRATSFIAMTREQEKKYLNLFGSDKEVQVIPLPVFGLIERSALNHEEILRSLSLPPGKRFILFFGIVRPYKGLDVLIEAMAGIHNQNKDVHLIIAGEFWEPRQNYERLISKYDLGKVIHIFDYYIPDQQAGLFFEIADCFVAPYRGGTQSGAAKIALGFGIPMVVSSSVDDDLLGSVTELYLKTQPGDVQDLTIKIFEALQKTKISDTAIEKINEQSWQQFVNGVTTNMEVLKND